jgi:hypothetical protein
MSGTALVVRSVFWLQVFASGALILPRPIFSGVLLALEAATRRTTARAFFCPGDELFSVVECLGRLRVVIHASFPLESR